MHYEKEDEQDQLYIEGFTRIRVNKNETVKFLRKQLQLLIIQVWSLLLSDENKYYLLDEFSCVSLFPAVQQPAPDINISGNAAELQSNFATHSVHQDN